MYTIYSFDYWVNIILLVAIPLHTLCNGIAINTFNYVIFYIRYTVEQPTYRQVGHRYTIRVKIHHFKMRAFFVFIQYDLFRMVTFGLNISCGLL